MSVHMQKQLQHVRELLLDLSTDVERAVHRSIQALVGRDEELAREVVEYDRKIDDKEVHLEEEVLHVLALEQPVAMDLRYLVSVLKVNNDLERIADMAVNISEQALLLASKPPIDLAPFLSEMAQQAERMLRDALDSLLELDVDKARDVRAMDDRVDAQHLRVIEHVERTLRTDPERSSQLLHMLATSRNLERIADLATNIAEDVIYMARGEILRHQAPTRD